ncbi:MAG: DMT family transporter [Rhizobiaceae bacterium]
MKMELSGNARAALLALVASAILSFIDNFVAGVAQEAGLWQFHVTRTLMAVPLLFVGARLLKVPTMPHNPKRLLIRSVILAAGLMAYFAALGFLPVAQAGAGLFSAPIWVLILSAVIFGRRLGLVQILATLGGFAGVLLVLGIDVRAISPLSLFPLLSGLFYGLGMMITRYWCSRESPAALAMGVFLVMGLFSLVMLVVLTIWPVSDTQFLLRGFEPISGVFLWLTLIQAVGAVIAVSLISQAYRIGDPPFVAVFEYSFLVFAALWAFIFWGRGLDMAALAGIGIIIVCGTYVSLRGATQR